MNASVTNEIAALGSPFLVNKQSLGASSFWAAAVNCRNKAREQGSTVDDKTCGFWYDESKCRGRCGTGCDPMPPFVNQWYTQGCHNHDFCADVSKYGGLGDAQAGDCNLAFPEGLSGLALNLGFTCEQNSGATKLDILGLTNMLSQ